MLGSSIAFGMSNVLTSSTAIDLFDDILLTFGNDSDIVMLNRSTGLNANTALANVLIGTPVSQAIAANSLMISNVTASGDIAMYGNLGGNSQQFLFYDTSASALYLRGTTQSLGSLDISAANYTIKGGADNGAVTRTNNTQKIMRVIGAHYTNTEQEVAALILDSNNTYTEFLWGGGSGAYNAATRQIFYAAAAIDTLTGTEMGRITTSGWQIGRDDTGVSTNSVTDALILQMGAGSSNEAAGFGLGISAKIGNGASQVEERGTLDIVLTDATDGSEDTEWRLTHQEAGAACTALSVGSTTSGSNVIQGVGIHTAVVTVDHASHGALNAAGLTDNALIWQQPAGSVLMGIRVKLTEQFAATGLTDIDITLGENGGDADGWLVQAMNGTSDAVGTQYKTRGALWDTSAEGVFSYQQSATDIYGFVTAVGANLDTLTAGTWTIYFTYMDLP